MTYKVVKKINLNPQNKVILSPEDQKRQTYIISKLNLQKLPFAINFDKICALNLELVRHSKLVLKYEEDKTGLKWVFSSIKKYKVFLLIRFRNFFKFILYFFIQFV